MTTLPWNKDILIWFANHRIDWVTKIFVAITFLGDEMGYILLIVSIYWLYNKRLAVQLVTAVILTSFVNHTLKIIIRNPRPFVTDGTYKQRWGIPASSMEETAKTFSTPSGHAQGSSTFWWYLHLKEQSRLTFVLLPIMVFLIGFSRVYLGVHYFEDVIIGWIVGFILVIFINRYDEKVTNWWNKYSKKIQVTMAIIPSLLFTIGAGILSDYSTEGSSYVTLCGIFSGIVLGVLLDMKYLNFSPDLSVYSNITSKILIAVGRMVVGLILVGLMLLGLDNLFALIAKDNTLLGFLLRWIRYLLVSFTGIFIAPLVFSKSKLS